MNDAVLRERIGGYIGRHPDATLPEVLGYFLLDPAESSDERAVAENALAEIKQPDASDGDEQRGVSA